MAAGRVRIGRRCEPAFRVRRVRMALARPVLRALIWSVHGVGPGHEMVTGIVRRPLRLTVTARRPAAGWMRGGARDGPGGVGVAGPTATTGGCVVVVVVVVVVGAGVVSPGL